MSRKDDWNRRVYDYTTLRTKYDIKERARAMAGYVGLCRAIPDSIYHTSADETSKKR